MCVTGTRPDAGPPAVDAGPALDAGGELDAGGADASRRDAGAQTTTDAGRDAGRDAGGGAATGGGCCSVIGSRSSVAGGLFLAALALTLARITRRRP